MAERMMSSQETPIASIVIPHYNDLENLDVCLDTLIHQSFPREKFEIIVADNMSTVGFEAVQACVGNRAELVLATERGAGPARNAGVAVSRAPILIFTDSDCYPSATYVKEALAALEGYDFVGGRVDVSVKDPMRITREEAFDLVFAFHNDRNINKMHFSVTANLITPRKVFDAVGGFRNGAPEDMDWCARAKALGFRIGYAEKAVVQHPARRTWPETVRKARRLTNEFFIMFQQKRFGILRWLVRTLMILFSIGPHGVAALTSPKLKSWKDRWGAFRVLVKIRVLRFIWAYEVMFRPV